MGLLNKATVNITIPNPLRDLDVIETVWFRPGRYARITMMHPDSAVITRTDTKTYPNSPGLLSKTTIPNREKLKQFYPYLTKSTKDIEEFETKLRKMNHVMFEGVITSFEFSYTKDGTIEASISLTGTSNIYTDISMFMPTPDNVKQSPKEQESKPKAPVNPVLDPKIDLTKRNSILDELINSSTITKVDADSLRNLTGESLKNRAKQLNISDDTINRLLETERDQSASAFYDALNIKFPIPDVAKFNGLPALLEKLKPEVTDQFYLVGEPYNNFSRTEYASKTNSLLNNLRLNRGIRTQDDPTLEQVSTSNIIPDVAVNFYRYITLGALIEFLNTYILTKLDNTVSNAKILCSDERCYSTYYSEMVSANPWEVLFLDTTNKHNRYGTTTFFDTTKIKDIKEWKGCYGNYRQVLNTDTFTSADTVFFPSRIFISLETIKEIIMGTDGKSGLSSGGKSSFTVKSFLTNISAKISQATGNAILLSLVTEPDPSFQSTLLFVDSKYVSRMDNEKNKAVVPYSIPMFANNSKGTLIRDFTLAAQLPENAKSLAYTLNGADKDGFEDEIAPYLNYMYQQNNADEINNTLKRYAENHKSIQVNLNVAKIDFGAFPKNPEKQTALRNTLIKYINILRMISS